MSVEITEEIVIKAWEAGACRKYHFGDVSSSTFASMKRALEAVLTDLQQPQAGVMHEIDKALRQVDKLKAELTELREYHMALEATNLKLSSENRQLETERDFHSND